ncbi:Fe-S cluster assembly sulfur transfer protein SufU [Gemmatimonas sp.]|jgi:nitrogen fixation NifU-like protein|uniref:Fe-S cluster assembly sulfur transfer protein SufU n=1 Tax=Gemmatimonas sp. TaxID=1962908 RepID=UPI0022C73EF0|nr:SUF system NifU family Fe-S cluster assembly protein [Gemmatimonas sp.]MCZ8203096.1 SUF system NifU family Fe-S cluster assembly protein [Gemmatimonas sp.]
MTDLQELYQSVILDHNRKPRNFGALPEANREADGKNPLCGDEVHVALVLQGDTITDVRFTGHGCAISKASASLMTAAVKGKTRAEAEALFERFHTLVLGKDADAGKDLGQLVVFSGVSRFPVRVKCASLAWHTLKAALESEASDPAAVSTE